MTKQEQALNYIQEQKYEDAAKIMIEIIDQNPHNPVGYVNFGNLLVLMQQFEEAERFFLKAIEIDDKTATAYYGLGNLYYDRNLFKEAESMFQKALRLELEDSDVYFMLGMTYVKREYFQLAIPFLQRASELDNDPEKLFQYGLALAQANFINEAETIFQQVIDIDKDHADSLYNLGIIEVHRENYKKAKDFLTKTIAMQPDHNLAITALHHLENS